MALQHEGDTFEHWIVSVRRFVKRCQDPRTNLPMIASFLTPPDRCKLHSAVTFLPSESEASDPNFMALGLQLELYFKSLAPRSRDGDKLLRRVLSLPSSYRTFCPRALRLAIEFSPTPQKIAKEASCHEVSVLLGKSIRPAHSEVLRVPQEWLDSAVREPTTKGRCCFQFMNVWKSAITLVNRKEHKHCAHMILTQISNTLHMRVDAFAKPGGCNVHVMIVFLSDISVVMKEMNCFPMNVLFGGTYSGLSSPCSLDPSDRRLLAKIAVLFGIGIDKVKHEIFHLVETCFAKSIKKLDDAHDQSVAMSAMMVQVATTVRNVCAEQDQSVRTAVLQALADSVFQNIVLYSPVPELDAQHFQAWLKA